MVNKKVPDKDRKKSRIFISSLIVKMTQNLVQNYYCYIFNMKVHIDMLPSIKHLGQRKFDTCTIRLNQKNLSLSTINDSITYNPKVS